jgi:hypothetical protein
MIIWLASYPRSGNTYLRILLKQGYDLRTYSVYDEDHPSPGRIGIQEMVGHTLKPMPLAGMARAGEVYHVKTHELPQDDFPAIYLVRDGRDALVSYARYILSFERGKGERTNPKAFRRTLRKLIILNRSFGGWGPNVLAWLRREAPTVVVKFEDLVKSSNPIEIVRTALLQVGYVPGETRTGLAPTFAELHEKMPEFFRKGRIGSYKEEMPANLEELFWRHHGRAMKAVGYRR